MDKKILYIDMDGVLVDFQSGIDKLSQQELLRHKKDYDEIPHIFSKMEPMPKAIESFKTLCNHYDTYILSTAPWENPTALNDKLEWVKTYLGDCAYKRLILTHHKNLNKGHYLIDDRKNNGSDKFDGELIHFGSSGDFKDWDSVINYLVPQNQ